MEYWKATLVKFQYIDKLEQINMYKNFYKNKRVLVTGHTGFKGSWLTSWLISLGAEVAGFSNLIPTIPNHFDLLGLEKTIKNYYGDIKNFKDINNSILDFKPQIIFHLAAQALVKDSIENPINTFETNAMGMVNLLSSLRNINFVEIAILITSDKAYENKEWVFGYRENDSLAGHDPYSASKSCADIIASSFFFTYFKNSSLKIGITRAGNVIGGGDWAKDRIIPDCIRSWTNNQKVRIRSPYATRPWQHVLEPLSGYLHLGEVLSRKNTKLSGEPFNFGPDANVNETVVGLLQKIKGKWDIANWEIIEQVNEQSKEANLLKLSCDKALHHLGWRAILGFEQTVEFTVSWYKNWIEGKLPINEFTQNQISEYENIGKLNNAIWSLN